MIQSKAATTLAGIGAAIVVAMAPAAHAGAFTPGNIVVQRMGDGSATLGSSPTAVFVDEYLPSSASQSSPVQSIAIPAATSGANNPLTASGSASSEGLMTRSSDLRYLCLVGYNTAASSSGTANTTVSRTMCRVVGNGTVDTTTIGSPSGSADNARSCTSADGSGFWTSQASQGLFYETYQGSSIVKLSGNNIREVNIFNGQLYYTSQSGSGSINAIGSGLPTSGSPTVTALTGLNSNDSTPAGFAMNSSATAVYIADEGGSTKGGIYKYTLSGTTLTFVYQLISGTAVRGIAVDFSGANPVIYATTTQTSNNKLIAVTDTSSSATATTLATSANNELFRGMALAPISAPTVTTPTKTAIADTTATLGANVTADGGAAITDYGIVWGTSPNPTTANNKVQKGTTETLGAFTVSATGLAAGTLIHYRGYAVNTVGTSYSSDDSFYTLSTVPSTHVGSFAAAAASSSSIHLTWTAATGANGYLVLQHSGASAPTGPPANATGYSVGDTIGDGTVAAIVTPGSATGTTINSLSSSSQYSYAIFPFAWVGSNAATYDYRTAATVPTASATTQAPVTPTINVTPASLSFPATVVGGTSANLTNTVSGAYLNDNITITAPANFQISTSPNSGFGSTVTLNQSGGTVASTFVYVRFQPTAQTSYSGNITNVSSTDMITNLVTVTGIGANLPAVTTQAATAQTTTGATLNGTVTANNGSAITDRGFYYKTSPGVTTSATQLSEGGTTVAAYSKALTGLSVNTIYYYRAYAMNAIGTNLDSSLDETNFYTLANPPAAPTISSPTTSSLNVAIGGSDGNPTTTTYAIQETTSGKYVQADGSLNTTAVFQTTASWGTKTVTGLGSGTIYTFQAAALNGAGVQTAFGPATTASTSALAFSAGDLAVLLAADTNANNTTFSIVELNSSTASQSSPVQTIAINGISGTSALRVSGSATSAPYLAKSDDGTLLAFAGANSTNTSTAVNLIAARGVGILDAFGNFALKTTYTGVTTGGTQPRGATTVDNSTWFIGDQGGIYSNGSSAPSPSGNFRAVKTFGGTVYVLQTTSGTIVVSTLSAATGGTVTGLPGLARDANASDFYLVSSGANGSTFDVLYTVGSDAIKKYSLVGGSWAANGSYTATNGFGLCAAANGGGASIYITTGSGATGANSVIKLTDAAGYNAAINVTATSTLYTAALPTGMKGIAFVPKTATSISVTSSKNPSGYKDSVSFTATLPSTATGNVIFKTNGVALSTNSISSGSATSAAITLLPRGTQPITAEYVGDNNYLGSTNNLSGGQTVTNHPPVAGASFTIFVTLGNASTVAIIGGKNPPVDADGDAVTVTGAFGAANGIVTTGDGTNLTYTATNGTSDSFTYTVDDGHGGTATGTVNVTISAPSGNGFNNVSAQVVGGNEVLNYAGIPGYHYALEWTHSLAAPVVWTPLVTNTASDTGRLSFTNKPSVGSDYYRTHHVP
jgi:hypothetical protein